MSFEIRIASKSEMSLLKSWAVQENWNSGEYDSDPFYEADPEGFYVGLLNNEPICTISLVRYEMDFAFLGYYITKKEFRGKGYGLKIFTHVVNKAENQGITSIGLDGVEEQQNNYMKTGFKLAHDIARYFGKISSEKVDQHHVIPISQVPFDILLAYDTSHFPDRREKFLRAWLSDPTKRYGVAYLKDGKVLGYGVIRKSVEAYRVGPLFAESNDVAREILYTLGNHVKEGFTIDVPCPNSDAVQLLVELGFQKTSITLGRMYRGKIPNLPLKKIYGFTTNELG